LDSSCASSPLASPVSTGTHATGDTPAPSQASASPHESTASADAESEPPEPLALPSALSRHGAKPADPRPPPTRALVGAMVGLPAPELLSMAGMEVLQQGAAPPLFMPPALPPTAVLSKAGMEVLQQGAAPALLPTPASTPRAADAADESFTA
jgi:hypothetical protein